MAVLGTVFVFLYPRSQIAAQFYQCISNTKIKQACFCILDTLSSFHSLLLGHKKTIPNYRDGFFFLWLPDLDSNQDKLHQKQSYYHYTIRQSYAILRMDCKNRVGSKIFQIIMPFKAIILKLA